MRLLLLLPMVFDLVVFAVAACVVSRRVMQLLDECLKQCRRSWKVQLIHAVDEMLKIPQNRKINVCHLRGLLL